MANLIMKPLMSFQGIKYGKRIKFKGLALLYKCKKSNLIIGDDVRINSSFLSNLLGLYARTIIVARTEYSKVIIGSGVGISGSTIYARNFISIGDKTLIGANCKIIDNDFHPIDAEQRILDDKSAIKSSPIVIGENCFIGCNSIILKGTHLGKNVVVGAGSVVSGSFPDNCVIAGNPAKIIRKIEE